MTIKEFKNGNINLQLENDDLTNIHNREAGFYGPGFMDIFSDSLSWNDCYLIGDFYSIGNFSTGQDIYNARRDLIYSFNYSEVENLRAGETVKLYARPVDNDSREIINSYLYND